MEVEYLQSLLRECIHIEVDVETLQNPTEEFLLTLLMEYLKVFHFDANQIVKPTEEQLACVSNNQDTVINAIKAINLHAAVSPLCKEIFIQDFMLTDVTNPGCKRVSKKIKVLFNFCLYVKNKAAEHTNAYLEIKSREKEMKDMIKKKKEIEAKTEALISERENQLEYKQKLLLEIEKIKLEMENDERESKKKQIEIEKVSTIHRKKVHELNNLKTKAHELDKTNKDLHRKIVKSPEKYANNLKELKKTVEEKKKERECINDSINRKKHQIQNNELAEENVKKCYDSMMNVGKTLHKLRDLNVQMQAIKNEIKEIKSEMSLLERELNVSEDEPTSSQSIDFGKSQRLLTELQKLMLDKQKEQRMLRDKLDQIQAEYAEKQGLLKKNLDARTAHEQAYADALKNFKCFFEKQIKEEEDFRKELD